MTGLQDIIFIGEIVLQSKIAQRAAERLKATHNNFDNVEVWCSIQSILVSTANVSKILWPHKQYNARGERLRQMLKIEQDNPLASRKFRNYFEHYDERIEERFEKYSGGVYVDLAMNTSFSGRGLTNDHRGYNSLDNTLMFRGELLDLTRILKALEQIFENCKPYTLT